MDRTIEGVGDKYDRSNLDFYFIFLKKNPGFDLDRDSQIQGTNDRDLKFRVHFAEPLQIQGLK
jgi:hypothetical protein